jgi:hypothetical protein
MTGVSADYSERLKEVINEVIAPPTAQVDRGGTFPRAGIEALGAAGCPGHD